MVLFEVLVFIYICMYWVFPDEEVLDDKAVKGGEEVEAVEGETSQEDQTRMGEDWTKFLFWLQIEVLMFGANLLSNIVFLFVRSCSQSRIRFGETDCTDGKDEIMEGQ